jgi:hypothetical protein
MIGSIHPIVLIALVGAVIAILGIVIACRVRVPLKLTPTSVLVSSLPSLLMIALFYSLAIHMYQSLGAWPTSIGERGFSSLLTTHAYIATDYFAILLLLSVIVWPVALLLCVIIRRWRGLVSYLGIHALSYLVCWGLLLLAPSQFLYWWWD